MRKWLPAIPVLLVPLALLVVSQVTEPTWARVPPATWVGVACAVGFAAWVAAGGSRPRWIDGLAVVALALGAGHLFLMTPGFPRGHDVMSHLWGIWGFFQGVLDGNPYPRWIHHVGLGMPLIQFYPPVVFFLLLPFLALGLAPYDAMKFGFVGFSVLAALVMFRVVSRSTGDRRAGLVSALAYVWAPYMLLDSHYRTGLAESAAFIFAPLFFDHGLRALREPTRRTLAWAALSAGLLVLTHPLSASMACTGMALWITVEWSPLRVGFKPWARKLLSYGVVGILGLCVAGFYTVPLAAESRYVTIGGALGSARRPLYTQHGLEPWQPLEPRRWSTWQMSEPTGSPADGGRREQPFYFGLALLLGIPLAAAGRRRSPRAQAGDREPARGPPSPRAPGGLIAIAIAGLLLTLRPFDWLGYLPNFRVLQFPWRFLWLATVGAAWCAGYATLHLTALARTLPGGAWAARLAPGILGAILILDGFPYTGAASWGAPYRGVAAQVRAAGPPGRVPDDAAAVPVPPPVPLRADGMFFFPPADYDVDLGMVRGAYPEYQTPAVREALAPLAEGRPAGALLEKFCVGWRFAGAGPQPQVIQGLAPYAEWHGAGAVTGLPFVRKGGVITVQLPGEAGRLVVKEQHFPGWRAETTRGAVAVTATPDGVMQLRVPEGPVEVTITFSEWRWDRLLGWLLSALTLIALFGPRRRRA